MQIKNKKFYHILMWIVLFSIPSLVSAQIATNAITGTNPNTSNPYTSGQTVASNATFSGIGRGSGITGTSANDRYNANSWNTGSLDATAYFTFTLTPATNYELDFTSFVYTGQASGTGPASFALRSSLDGFTANIGSPSATGTTISLAAGTYQNLTSAVEFRFYGWGASAAAGTFSINGFTFNGTVSCITPVFSVHPSTTPQSYANGAPTTALTVTASNAVSYQWFSNNTASNSGGSNLGSGSGAQTASYTPQNTSAGTLYYYCVVQGAGSCTATSNVSGAITIGSGTSPDIITSINSVSGIDTNIYTISGVKTFTVSGDNLTNDVDMVFTSGDFEMSQTSATTGFNSTLTLAQSGGNLTGEPVTIWVRLKAQTTTGAVTDTIQLTSAGATMREVALSGTVSGTFYSKSTGNLEDVANWGINTDGTGTNPPNFTSALCTYNVRNRTAAAIGASWTVSGTSSKIVVGDGLAATDLDIPAAMTITGTIDISNLGELTMNNTTLAHTYGTRAANSTLEYAQSSSFTIPVITYNNLKLTNSTKVWAGNTTTVSGNLTYENVALDGASSNPFSTLNLAGNLTVNGTLTNPPIANSYTFVCTSSGTQTISGNGQQLNFFRLQTTGTSTIILSNSSGGTNLQVGNTAGGGFSLIAGSTLVMNDNSITTVANVNAVFVAATTGVIRGSANASLTINSTAATVGTMYMDQTTPGTTNVLKNLTYNLTNASGTMVLGNELRVAGLLTHTDGQLTTGGFLVLSATGATNYGQIAGTGAGTISGNLTANFMITGGGEGWRPLCSPVSGATLAQLSDDYNLDFGAVNKAAANTYYFNESAAPYWNIASGTSASMNAGAYSIYMGGAASWANPLPITMDITGTYAGTSDYSPSSLTRSGSIADTMGWHYIRNPWPSGFLWDGTTATVTGIADVQGQQVWAFNQADSTYSVFDNSGNGVIPPFTPFVVQAATNGTNLTFLNSARYTDSLKNYFDKTGMENYLELTLTDPAGKTDVAKWYTLPEATDGYDNFDGNKRMNIGAPNLYFMLEGNKANKEVWKNIPGANTPIFLNLQGRQQGTYNLHIAMDNFAPGVEAFITDLSTQKVHKVDSKPYSFVYTPGEAAGRFTLHFAGGISSVSEHIENDNIVKVGNNGSDIIVIVNRTGNFDVTVYDVLGRPVHTARNIEGNAVANTLSLSGLAAGYYMVNVIGEGISQTQKVHIQ